MQLVRKLPPAIAQHPLDWTILCLLAVLYTPLLVHWYNGWLNKSISIEHEYFSHGLIGLPFAFYIFWSKRQTWWRLPDQAHPLGMVLLLLAGGFYLTGLPDWVNLSLPLLLIGLCLWLKGFAGLKLQQFPLLLVLLATPTEIPYLLTPYTLPLQSLIANVAGFFLIQLGLNVSVEQIYLTLNGQIVEVAPYCAGLKMLFTSLYVSLMLLYWTGNLACRSLTGLFLALAVVTSVAANILRNTLLTYFHGTGREQAFQWLHQGWGGDVYSTCMLVLLVLLLNFLERYFPSPAEEE